MNYTCFKDRLTKKRKNVCTPNCSFFFFFRLQELSTSSTEENPDYSDIELIQHINVDVNRLIKLLNGKKKLVWLICCLFVILQITLYLVL